MDPVLDRVALGLGRTSGVQAFSHFGGLVRHLSSGLGPWSASMSGASGGWFGGHLKLRLELSQSKKTCPKRHSRGSGFEVLMVGLRGVHGDNCGLWL